MQCYSSIMFSTHMQRGVICVLMARGSRCAFFTEMSCTETSLLCSYWAVMLLVKGLGSDFILQLRDGTALRDSVAHGSRWRPQANESASQPEYLLCMSGLRMSQLEARSPAYAYTDKTQFLARRSYAFAKSKNRMQPGSSDAAR